MLRVVPSPQNIQVLPSKIKKNHIILTGVGLTVIQGFRDKYLSYLTVPS